MNNIDKIYRDKPFNSLLEITNIRSLDGTGAISGQSYHITGQNGREYKLRVCRDQNQVDKISNNVTKLPDLFPNFYGAEQNYVLFDWLKGQEVTKASLTVEISKQIGEMTGKAHGLNDIDTNKNPESFFQAITKNIIDSKVLTKLEIENINKTYSQLRSKVNPDIVLEFNDIHFANYLISEENKVYFIDEDGFGYKIKGLGLAKPLLIQKIFEGEKLNAFWQGYTKYSDNAFFTEDYRKYVAFVQLVRSLAAQTRAKRDITKQKARLIRYM